MFKFLQTALGHRNAYSERIKARHQHFWMAHNAEETRNTLMSSAHSIDEWKNVSCWQRRLSNKRNAREFAKRLGCQVARLIWEGKEVDTINFLSLPDRFIIRPTIGHSSKSVFLMKDGINLFDNKRYPPEEIIVLLKQQLEGNKYLHFLIEEFLPNESGNFDILKDYKVFCFNGEVACILVIDRISPNVGTACYYDANWNLIQPVEMNYPCGVYQKPPVCLNDILIHAKRLSKAYNIFVRIDFYASAHGAVFGEFTPTPGMGGRVTKYGQQLLLSYWNRYCAGLI